MGEADKENTPNVNGTRKGLQVRNSDTDLEAELSRLLSGNFHI